jgi:hypothetical protein
MHILNPTLVVTVNQLQRHLNNKKIYFGCEEFQLMVEQALADTIHRGHKVTPKTRYRWPRFHNWPVDDGQE